MLLFIDNFKITIGSGNIKCTFYFLQSKLKGKSAFNIMIVELSRYVLEANWFSENCLLNKIVLE